MKSNRTIITILNNSLLSMALKYKILPLNNIIIKEAYNGIERIGKVRMKLEHHIVYNAHPI